MGVPLEPPGPLQEYQQQMTNQEGRTTADIIAAQSQDYVDEKLAEYQATIYQLQGKSVFAKFSSMKPTSFSFLVLRTTFFFLECLQLSENV